MNFVRTIMFLCSFNINLLVATDVENKCYCFGDMAGKISNNCYFIRRLKVFKDLETSLPIGCLLRPITQSYCYNRGCVDCDNNRKSKMMSVPLSCSLRSITQHYCDNKECVGCCEKKKRSVLEIKKSYIDASTDLLVGADDLQAYDDMIEEAAQLSQRTMDDLFKRK